MTASTKTCKSGQPRRYCCCLRRKEATELLRVRKESKLEAQRQYLAAKALPVTAT